MTLAEKAKLDGRDSDWRQLWAKTGHDGTNMRWHPLLCHMLDVAAVAGLVWDKCMTSALRGRLESMLGIENARAYVMFLAGAHDIGKACPGFQEKRQELVDGLGLRFSDNDQSRPHGCVSASVVREFLGVSSRSTLLGQVVGAHHGLFPRSGDLCFGRDTLGNNDWRTARHELLTEFADGVGVNLSRAIQVQREITDPYTVPILAGFISVVDWIGSNQDFFSCIAEQGEASTVCAADYWHKTQEQARNALESLGWLPPVAFAHEAGFDSIFSGFVPNALQAAAIKLASEQTCPYLMIIEAPMGKGKTEAALYAADLAMCRGFARGMYIAMPTQATSNAMFRRVLEDYLRQRGHQGKLNLQLVHGDALLARTAKVSEGEIPSFKPNDIGEERADVEAQSWFSARKRPLLAPFGVGTIDQSLLSVLQTKHWFVRLFGLAGKVIIFDEVHAYDAYMNTILERLLRWLAEVDCTVILLSATLPESKGKALAKAYSGREDANYRRYPRITLAQPWRYPDADAGSVPICAEIPTDESGIVGLGFAKTDPQALSTALAQQLEHGGCAAVICNTVNRAIEVYKHLRDNLKDIECMLFHARTLQMWRRKREEEVLRKFGRGERLPDGTYANPHRPTRAVLVATQVIEQSLDLDFDLMVSEIAPIDLLLQRLGRLHRHPRQRPANLKTPQFIMLCDAEREGLPPESFGKSIEFVYDRYILLRTWLVLRDRDEINVPTQIESLVESVYGSDPAMRDGEWVAALENAKDEREFKRSESEKSANRLLVSKPKNPSDLIEEFNTNLADDEDPEVHKTVRAATREGDPSITAVVVPEDAVLADEPDIPEVRRLLDHSTKLSHKGVFNALLLEGESPKEWTKNAHLRHARLLRLDERKRTRVGGYVLTVDEELGVIIEKEEENNG